MTNKKQERVAKMLLGAFLDVWCSVDERDEDSISNNCHHCEFETDAGMCLAKLFVHNEKYSMEFPEGNLTVDITINEGDENESGSKSR